VRGDEWTERNAAKGSLAVLAVAFVLVLGLIGVLDHVQANVPPENVVAMFDAAWRYGG